MHRPTKFFVSFVVTLSLLLPALPVQAASLTPDQISAVLSVLQSFGIDQTTLTKVGAALNGQSSSVAPAAVSTPSMTAPALSPAVTIAPAVSSAATVNTVTVNTDPNALNLSGYKLTFDDEFTGINLNESGTPGHGTWQTYFYFGDRVLNSNGEQEYYMDPDYKGSANHALGVNPFSIVSADSSGDTALQIEAKPTDPSVKPYIWGYNYTSGLITTEPSFSQTYGYFEMRAELPQGKGLWPAFWLLPVDKSWPPELDPLEAFGATNANGEGGSNKIHIGEIATDGHQSNGQWITLPAGNNIYTGYHTYGIMWDPVHLTYFVDGKKVAQYTTPSGDNKPMYMLANLAVGGNWPGKPDSSNTWPAHMKIDYIRAYSKDPNAVVAAPQAGFGESSNPAPTQTQTQTAPPVQNQPPPPTQTQTPPVSTSPVQISNIAAQLTPAITRAYVQVGSNGIATGSSKPSDLFNTAAGQTLIGNGGDDIFHIGSYSNTTVQENGQGISEVSTWVSFVLPGSVNNLSANGNYAHRLTGNSGSNVITASTGNDTLDGAGGNDLLIGGAGNDIFVVKQGYGNTQINGFHAGDFVALENYGFANASSVLVALHQVNSDTALNLPDGHTVTFKNTAVSSFTANEFGFSESAASVTTTTSTTTTTPAPSTPTPHTSSAKPTPNLSRSYVAPGSYGIATGSTNPSDIFNTASGQTLIGNSGNDVFHVGSYSNTNVQEQGSGISEVSTWTSFTLPGSVDNLSALGSYAHTLMGNGGDNYIVGSPGNDTINGEGGSDTIVVGTGANTITGGANHSDTFVFGDLADHGNTVTDFAPNTDMLDLTGLIKSMGYTGSDPVADHHLRFEQSGSNTLVVIDPHANGDASAHTVVVLDNVLLSSLTVGVNYLWH